MPKRIADDNDLNLFWLHRFLTSVYSFKEKKNTDALLPFSKIVVDVTFGIRVISTDCNVNSFKQKVVSESRKFFWFLEKPSVF